MASEHRETVGLAPPERPAGSAAGPNPHPPITPSDSAAGAPKSDGPPGGSLRAHAVRVFGKPGTPTVGWLLVLLIICAVSFGLRSEQIDGSLPYPTHPDEGAVMKPAANILKTGHYHPGRFIYPSLPIYLAAGGLGIGFIRAAAKLEVQTVQDIGNVSYPYYSVPTMAETARRLFALFSVVAVAATGAVAFFLLQRAGALALAPLILALSPFFFLMSWRYVNVDIVGTCFVALAVAAALRGTRRPGYDG